MDSNIVHYDCGCMEQYRRSRKVAEVRCGRDNCLFPAPDPVSAPVAALRRAVTTAIENGAPIITEVRA